MNKQYNRQKLIDFCKRNHVVRLAVFGSAIHGDERPDSDLDVLVVFEEGFVPGLKFFTMEEELSSIFFRKVDLSTPGFLSRYFRNEVLAEAEVQYAAS